jgi:hypothetical protein
MFGVVIFLTGSTGTLSPSLNPDTLTGSKWMVTIVKQTKGPRQVSFKGLFGLCNESRWGTTAERHDMQNQLEKVPKAQWFKGRCFAQTLQIRTPRRKIVF